MILRPSFAEPYPEIVCALSTRLGGVSGGSFGMNLSFAVGDDPAAVAGNRRRFFGLLGIPEDALVLQKQVHGAEVRGVHAAGVLEATDGSYTAVRGIYLCVTVADCVPVFLFDPGIPAVGVVHAGWRGTVAGIAARGVEGMVRGCGADPSRMLACIGPSASVCCYEVGQEVASRLPAGCTHRTAGGWKVDLKEANRLQLTAAGIPEGAVSIDGACTICGADLFHSHRRDGSASGRMMGVIGIRPSG